MLTLKKSTLFNWQETVATLLGVATLVAGVYLGFKINADWLGRAGSLLIVYGVVLATTRKFDVLHSKVLKFIDAYRKNNKALLRDEFYKMHKRQPTDVEALSAELDVYQSAMVDMADLIDERRRVFKAFEVALVIIGTVVNGFGPWLVTCAKSAA